MCKICFTEIVRDFLERDVPWVAAYFAPKAVYIVCINGAIPDVQATHILYSYAHDLAFELCADNKPDGRSPL